MSDELDIVPCRVLYGNEYSIICYNLYLVERYDEGEMTMNCDGSGKIRCQVPEYGEKDCSGCEKCQPCPQCGGSKHPDEWEKITGVEILDPDGWRNEKKDWGDDITIDEFMRLAIPSTCKWPFDLLDGKRGPCPTCKGTGEGGNKPEYDYPCPTCGGRGEIESNLDDIPLNKAGNFICPTCGERKVKGEPPL